MKKIIGFILLLTQLSCAKPPQDSITFKVQFQPETKYNQTTGRTSQTVIKYTGSEISLHRLKDRGIQNPTISNKKTQKEYQLTTGKQTDGISFPCNVLLLKTTNMDGKKDGSDGAIFHGHCLVGDMPVFDSVALEGLDQKQKASLLQIMQNTLSQLIFPVKKLKIGEQFSVEYPLTIPMEGSTVEMVVTTNYKLIRILNNMANFDISQEYTMSPVLLDNSFKGTGKGKGKMVYDVAHTIILDYSINTEMEMNKKLDSFEFNLKAVSGFIQTTRISK